MKNLDLKLCMHVCVCIACICMCIYLWHKTRKQLVRGEKSFKGTGKMWQCVHKNSKGRKGSQRGGGSGENGWKQV